MYRFEYGLAEDVGLIRLPTKDPVNSHEHHAFGDSRTTCVPQTLTGRSDKSCMIRSCLASNTRKLARWHLPGSLSAARLHCRFYMHLSVNVAR